MENIMFFTPDIATLIQSVHLGPQARVKELIDEFNDIYERYMSKNLDITKKFYWKPGAYDSIKQVIWHLSDLHRKANSLTKVVQRSRDANFRLRNVIRSLEVIETILFDFRLRGMIQQDNTDDAIEAWNIIKNHLLEQLNNGINRFSIYIEPIMRDNELRDYYINIIYKYEDVIMNYKHIEGDTIADIEIPGEGHLTVKIPISRLINNLLSNGFEISNLTNFSNRRHNNRKWDYSIGGDWSGYDGIAHPYIATNDSWYSNGHDNNFKYVCVGNLETEIQGCISSLDFISLNIFFDRIMTHYDTNTGPLNQLEKTFHGVPKFLEHDEEFWEIRGKRSWDLCDYPIDDYNEEHEWVKEDSYCAVYCTLKDECVKYKRNAKELTKEEITQKALEQATLQLARGGR